MQSSCILIPNRDEMFTLKGSIYGAGVNLILNFIFIPLWKENGAALTTLLYFFTILGDVKNIIIIKILISY